MTGWKPIFRFLSFAVFLRVLRASASFHSPPTGAKQARRPFSNTAETAMLPSLIFASSSARSAPPRFVPFSSHWRGTGWKPVFHDRLEAYPPPSPRDFPDSFLDSFAALRLASSAPQFRGTLAVISPVPNATQTLTSP